MKKIELAQLTGLRSFAAWGVVLFHSGYMLQPLSNNLFRLTKVGYLGVDVFFVLSGFVIAYNYMDTFQQRSRERWRKFVWMRLARIYPLHLFTLLIALLLYCTVRTTGLHTVKDFSGWTAKSFVENVFMVHAWIPHPHDSWNNASWSISSEWFAYLLFPLIVYTRALRFSSWRWSLVIGTLAATVPPLVLRINSQVPFFDLIEVFFEFVAGCLIYVAFKSVRYHAAMSYIAGGLIPTGIGLWLVLRFLNIPVRAYWIVSLFPLLVMYLAASKGFVQRIMCSRFTVYWGKVSYSLYMTHNITLWFLKYSLPSRHDITDSLRYVLYLLAVAGVASLTYHLIEQPARNRLRAVIAQPGATAVPVLI